MRCNHGIFLSRLLFAGVLVASSAAGAGGGGGFSGGHGGDSSMNPYTGDSFAYFNCGHNLGEEGMMLPGRPNPQSPEEKARRATNPPQRNGTCVPSQTTTDPRNAQVPDSTNVKR